MTINSTINRESYACNGVTTAFPFHELFSQASDLVVLLVDDALGTSSTLVLNTDYTVTGAGDPAGGTVTTVVTYGAGNTLVIYRDPPATQLVDLVQNATFPPEAVESALDKLTMLVQRLKDLVSRSFVFPDSYTGGASAAVPAPSASKFIRWNAAASGLENADVTGAGAIGVPVPILQGGTNATSAAAARTSLGAAPTASPAFTGDGSITGNMQVGSLNGGSLAPHNRIINGDMRIDQRNEGAAKTFTAGAALAYCVDRWYGYCTGANVAGQRVAGSGDAQYRYRFTGAASVTAIGFGQRIEKLHSYDLNSRTCTLSVDLANSLLTTVAWTAYYANTDDTFGTLASPTRTQIATGTFTVTSSVTRYSTQISVPAAATTGVEIVFTVGAQTSGTWTIGDVQLEKSPVATPFQRRMYSDELIRCQRRYEKSFDQGTAPAQNIGTGTGEHSQMAVATGGTAFRLTVPFKVTKGSAPATITAYNPGNSNGQVRDSTATGDCSGTTIVANATSSFFIHGTPNASGIAASRLVVHWTAEAEL